MSKKRGKKKLALKRETLRKLDNNELGRAAGGYIAKTTLCGGATGGCAYTVSGGCTDTTGGCLNVALDPAVLLVKVY